MGRHAQVVLAVALAFSFLLSGCAMQNGGAGKALTAGGEANASGTGFLVPESRAAYTAYYIVNEGGQETDKTVYRMGRKMRMDYGLGGANISVFFLDDKAYSCARSLASGEYGCFDITESAASQGVSSLIGEPDLENAEMVEMVDVGSSGQMKAQCYIFSSAAFPARKTCFVEGAIPAYDEYVLGNGQKHVEYLAYLKMDANLRNFGLPATPVIPPKNLTEY
ncbi:MAG: hypothetical protein WCT52_01145 [Candidatus Micrarchaeia archaeon]